MRYTGWILPAVVMATLAGCGKSSGAASSLTYQPLDWGPRSTQPTAKPVTQASPTTPQVRTATPPASSSWEPRNPKPWRYIVIHHSATASGNAATFHKAHLANGWDGLGYHFVIGNGTSSGDGVVEVGYRWRDQKTGAHTGKTPNNAYNEYGIGICLVGNFNKNMPSQAQLASLNRLVCYLQDQYNIPPSRVVGHREAPNAATECPGNQLNSYLRHSFRPYLASRMGQTR